MNYLEKNKENFIEDLRGLIKIKSYLTESNNYPNQEVLDVVNYMVNLGKKENFKTYADSKGYYGYIEIGEGEEMIGILGHLDVVPPGNDLSKWNNQPFDLIFEDGFLKGRGTQDDKGPVMMAFYLLKEIKSLDLKLNKRIRLIFPTDEESFWRGVEKYKSDGQEMPIFGITPDSKFPVTYSERELWEFKIIGKPTDEFEIEAGLALNVVPDEAQYKNKEGKVFKTEGKAAHASEPENGENAITKIVEKIDSDNQIIKFIKNEINSEFNGKTLFGEIFKDDDAKLTLNLGVLNINSSKCEALFDLRIPNTISAKELEKILLSKLKEYSDLSYEVYDILKGVYIPKDSDLIKKLMDSYKRVTGNEEIPIASGGATYARSMDNIVAYGPFFKDSILTEHQYNEQADWNEFIKAYDIYKDFFINILK